MTPEFDKVCHLVIPPWQWAQFNVDEFLAKTSRLSSSTTLGELSRGEDRGGACTERIHIIRPNHGCGVIIRIQGSEDLQRECQYAAMKWGELAVPVGMGEPNVTMPQIGYLGPKPIPDSVFSVPFAPVNVNGIDSTYMAVCRVVSKAVDGDEVAAALASFSVVATAAEVDGHGFDRFEEKISRAGRVQWLRLLDVSSKGFDVLDHIAIAMFAHLSTISAKGGSTKASYLLGKFGSGVRPRRFAEFEAMLER